MAVAGMGPLPGIKVQWLLHACHKPWKYFGTPYPLKDLLKTYGNIWNVGVIVLEWEPQAQLWVCTKSGLDFATMSLSWKFWNVPANFKFNYALAGTWNKVLNISVENVIYDHNISSWLEVLFQSVSPKKETCTEKITEAAIAVLLKLFLVSIVSDTYPKQVCSSGRSEWSQSF